MRVIAEWSIDPVERPRSSRRVTSMVYLRALLSCLAKRAERVFCRGIVFPACRVPGAPHPTPSSLRSLLLRLLPFLRLARAHPLAFGSWYRLWAENVPKS